MEAPGNGLLTWFVSGALRQQRSIVAEAEGWDKQLICDRLTTQFNNCFIIQSPSLFSYFNHSLAAQGSDLLFSLENVVQLRMSGILFTAKTRLDGTTHEQTIICSQLFAGHVVGFRPLERKKKMHRRLSLLLIGSFTKENRKMYLFPCADVTF